MNQLTITVNPFYLSIKNVNAPMMDELTHLSPTAFGDTSDEFLLGEDTEEPPRYLDR